MKQYLILANLVIFKLYNCDLIRGRDSSLSNRDWPHHSSFGNDGQITGNSDTKASSDSNYNQWEISLSSSITFRTVFFAECDDCSCQFPYTFSSANEIPITGSGWFQIQQQKDRYWLALKGSRLEFQEIMLFNEYPVQQNAHSTTLSPAAFINSNSNNAIRLNGMKLSTPTYFTSSTTISGGANAFYMIQMKAETKIMRVVPIVGYDDTLFTKDLQVDFININNVVDNCGTSSNVNMNPDDSFSCDKPAYKIKIFSRSITSILSLASVGLLSECKCEDTTFDTTYMPNYVSNFQSSSINVMLGDAATTITLTLYDSISLVCGDGLGITFCGSRTVHFFEKSNEETNLVQFDSSTSTVTVQATTSTQIGTHTYKLKVDLPQYSKSFDLTSSSLSLTVTVTATNCVYTQLTWSQPAIKTTTLLNQPVSMSLVQSTDTLSFINGNNDGHSYCGARTLSIFNDGTSNNITTFFTYNDATNTLTYNFPISAGVKVLNLVISLVNYSSVTLTLSQIIEITVIDPCATTTLNNWSQVALNAVTLSVGETKLVSVNALPSDTVSDSGVAQCGAKQLTFYENGSQVSSYISHDSTANQITIAPTSLSQVKTYTLTLKITMVQYTSITIDFSATWTVKITGCEETVLTWPQTLISQAVVISQTVTNNLVYSTDSVSVLNVPDGRSFCGPRSLTIIDDATPLALYSGTLVQYSSATNSITISATSKSEIGTHTYSLKIKMADYPSITYTASSIVQVTVTSGCEATVLTWAQTFTPTSVILGQTQTVGLTQSSDSVSISQSDPTFCGSRSLLIYEGSNLVTGYILYDSTTNTIEIQPTTKDQEGVHNYRIVMQLTDYPSITLNLSDQLQVTITSGCELTSIDQWTQVLDPISISLGSSSQIQMITPTDQVSFNKGNLDGKTYCADRVLQVIDMATNTQVDLTGAEILVYDQSTSILKINPTATGTFSYQLYFTLLYYPTILQSNSQFLDITVTEIVVHTNLPPYFLAPPSSSYTIAQGGSLSLDFILQDQEQDSFTIVVDAGKAASFTKYETATEVGKGSISFDFSPQITQRQESYQIKITVTEIYNETTYCTTPSTKTYTFNIKVKAQTNNNKTNTSAFEYKTIQTVDLANQTRPNISFFKNQSHDAPLDVRIANISRLALVTITFNWELDIDPEYLKVKFEQNSLEMPIKFNYTVVKIDKLYVQIQCNFSKPLSVSVGDMADEVLIQLPAWMLQKGAKTESLVFFPLVGHLPMLIGSQKELNMLNKVSDTIGNSASVIFWVYLAVNVLFGFALSMLWGTFQTLQIITALPLLQIKIPPNVVQIFQGFNDIINMKIIDSKTVYDYTIGLIIPKKQEQKSLRLLQQESNSTSSVSPDEQSAQFLGIKADNIVNDLVMVSLGLIVLLILIGIIVYCYKKIYPIMPKLIQNIILAIKRKVMWNSILRYSAQSYLATAIVCMMNISAFQTLTLSQQIITPFTFLYILFWPFIIFYILKRNRDQLHTVEAKASLGSLFMNYETDKNSVLHFTMWFLIRRFIFAFTIGVCKVNIVLQIYISIFGSLALISYLLYWNPMEANHYNYLSLFNEIVLYVCITSSFLFTEFVPVPETRYLFGNYFLYMLYINLGLNLITLGYEITRQIMRQVRKVKYQRKILKKRKNAILRMEERLEVLSQLKQQNQKKNADQILQLLAQQMQPKNLTQASAHDITAFEATGMVSADLSSNQIIPRQSTNISQLNLEPTSPKHLYKNKPLIIANLKTDKLNKQSQRSNANEYNMHRNAQSQSDASSVSSVSMRSIQRMITQVDMIGHPQHLSKSGSDSEDNGDIIKEIERQLKNI